MHLSDRRNGPEQPTPAAANRATFFIFSLQACCDRRAPTEVEHRAAISTMFSRSGLEARGRNERIQD